MAWGVKVWDLGLSNVGFSSGFRVPKPQTLDSKLTPKLSWQNIQLPRTGVPILKTSSLFQELSKSSLHNPSLGPQCM